jgi:hypothetical protein
MLAASDSATRARVRLPHARSDARTYHASDEPRRSRGQPQNGLSPRRWKQWALSTIAVLLLTTLVPTALSIALQSLGLAPHGALHGVLSAAVISNALSNVWVWGARASGNIVDASLMTRC